MVVCISVRLDERRSPARSLTVRSSGVVVEVLRREVIELFHLRTHRVAESVPPRNRLPSAIRWPPSAPLDIRYMKGTAGHG